MANILRSNNPVLKESAFAGQIAAGEAMTMQGTANKTGLLLLCVVVTSAYAWGLGHSQTPEAAVPWMIGGAIGVASLGDNYQVANTLPTMIYILVGGGALNAVFVPQLVRAMKNDEDGGEAGAGQALSGERAGRSGSSARWSYGSCGQSSAHAFCETWLAEDCAADIAAAIGAQRLSACAAVGHCCNSVVRGAVHTNLLVVVTDTAGAGSGSEAKTGWFSSRL